MANHLRRQIRDYVAGSIVDSLTTTGARVQQTPIYPLATESLPGLAIFIETEDVEVVTQHATNRELNRSMILVIEGVVLMASTILNSLDLISKEVEEAMAGNRTINSLARDSVLQSTDFRFEPEAHIPVGIVRLNYSVEYANLETASDAVA
jgi:hypothetical protein